MYVKNSSSSLALVSSVRSQLKCIACPCCWWSVFSTMCHYFHAYDYAVFVVVSFYFFSSFFLLYFCLRSTWILICVCILVYYVVAVCLYLPFPYPYAFYYFYIHTYKHIYRVYLCKETHSQQNIFICPFQSGLRYVWLKPFIFFFLCFFLLVFLFYFVFLYP